MKKNLLFDNPEDNKKLNRYFDDSLSVFAILDKEIAWDIIDGYRTLVPAWDISMAYNLVDLASLELQKRDYIKALKKGKISEGLSRLFNAIDTLKKAIGIDPKNIGAKGEGSMSETFLELCGRVKFQTRRYVCKPIFGYGENTGSPSSKYQKPEPLEEADDATLENFLQKAEMK